MKLYKKQIKPVWETRDCQGYCTRYIDVEQPEQWYDEDEKEQLEEDIWKHPKIVKGSVKYSIKDAQEAIEIEKRHPNLKKKPYSDSALRYVNRFILEREI